MVQDDLYFPQDESFHTLSKEQKQSLWRKNHLTLVEYLQSTPQQYFGIFNIHNEYLETLLSSQTGGVQVLTFKNKDRSERRIYQLYQMCAVAIGDIDFVSPISELPSGMPLFPYEQHPTFHSKDRNIIILNLDDAGKNISKPFEHVPTATIFPGSPYSQLSRCLGGGWMIGGEEDNNLDRLDDEKNRLWKGSLLLTPQNFQTYYKGKIAVSTLEEQKFLPIVELNNGHGNKPITLAGAWFFIQYVLSKTFDIMNEKK